MKDIQTFRLADADKITNLPVNTNTELGLKADKSTTYTKTETDNILSNKVDKTTTVNGKALYTNVTINKSDVGLGNVDNTADANKPISTATQTALDGKVDNVIAGTNTTVSRNGNTITVNSLGGPAVVTDGFNRNYFVSTEGQTYL